MHVLLCTGCKMLTVVLVVKKCAYMYIALYSVVNGPERSSRFYVFYNESIHIMVTIEYSLFGYCIQNVKFKVQLFRLVIH